ncbi:hypothetical protein RFI_07922 [Reticulomyxa filosa]|uniref:Uncharacterized protein n=1 Tax=Reticulomyxa filosa TaxID=46433 RepID=X6NSD6_RETFI|nr:hypothetical protein RFI_07922 [Reticulomyxa filosa]|eukprot:ETO29205.1 hypothetical protein RFI_07922 [Reticulomyxa filosa]
MMLFLFTLSLFLSQQVDAKKNIPLDFAGNTFYFNLDFDWIQPCLETLLFHIGKHAFFFVNKINNKQKTKGKKIRKNSDILKAIEKLGDICSDWTKNYRVARRKSSNYLYLVSTKEKASLEKMVNEMLITYRPNFVRSDSKVHKSSQKMCDVLSERLEQSLEKGKQNAVDETKTTLYNYCTQEYPLDCQEAMFNTTIEWRSVNINNKEIDQDKASSKEKEDFVYDPKFFGGVFCIVLGFVLMVRQWIQIYKPIRPDVVKNCWICTQNFSYNLCFFFASATFANYGLFIFTKIANDSLEVTYFNNSTKRKQ